MLICGNCIQSIKDVEIKEIKPKLISLIQNKTPSLS